MLSFALIFLSLRSYLKAKSKNYSFQKRKKLKFVYIKKKTKVV
jgi:hypothetical protein